MLRLLKHLADWAVVAAFGSRGFKSADPRRDEQAAAMHLWPTTGRDVQATPKKAPVTLDTSRRSTEERTLDGYTS